MISRKPKGTPTGGEFAANEHDEASASLEPEKPLPAHKQQEIAYAEVRESEKKIWAALGDRARISGHFTKDMTVDRRYSDGSSIVIRAAEDESQPVEYEVKGRPFSKAKRALRKLEKSGGDDLIRDAQAKKSRVRETAQNLEHDPYDQFVPWKRYIRD